MQMSGLLNGAGENYICLAKPHASLGIKWYKNSKECQPFSPNYSLIPLAFLYSSIIFTTQSDFQTLEVKKSRHEAH